MPDNERARIRQIMYEPSAVWLATEYSGDRWITDQFVLYNVTGAEVLQCYDVNLNYDVEWPDGPYQLMATGEWRAKQRDSIPEPDIETYFGIMAESVWVPADPTEWSVAEHPGKAMLWVSYLGDACLLGESTWTAIKRHHPEVMVEHSPNKGAGVFRFSEPPDDCNVAFESPAIPFAYAAGIRVPEGQEDVAHAIAQAVNRTSNEEAA